MLTAVQLMLAILGACAYNADETLYPELDEDPPLKFILFSDADIASKSNCDPS